MTQLSKSRIATAAVLLAGAAHAQVVFEEPMTNWAHTGTAGWTDDFALAGSKAGKVDRLDSVTSLNYTRVIASLKKGHYVATIRIQKFKSITGTAPLTFEVTNSPGSKEVTIPFSQYGPLNNSNVYKFLDKWTWIQTVVFSVPSDNASMLFRLHNTDTSLTKQDYYFDWFKIGQVPEGKVLKYHSLNYSYAPWSLANQGGGRWYKDDVVEKTSAFGEVTEVTGNNWLEHRSFYGWNAKNVVHEMILQPGTYTYNFRVYSPSSGKWPFNLQHKVGSAAWVVRTWQPAEQANNAWQLSPNISFDVTAANTGVRFIFKNTNSGGKFGYKFDSFMVRRGAFDVSGTPCKSSLGDVEISGSIPQLGETFAVSVNSAPSVAVFFIGATTLNIDMTSAGMTGCTLYTAPILTLPAASVSNVATLSIPLPNSSSLIGTKFREQALVLDAKANAFGAALSTVGSALIQN